MLDDHPITISVAPASASDAEVEYYQTVGRSIILTNASESRTLVEDITLRFQSDAAEVALNVRHECGWELAPAELREQRIKVTPTPLYLENTNQFDVKVRYRTLAVGHVSDPRHEVVSNTSYIIIREPRATIGQAFISLKQPQDLDLGRLMARMSRRAGITPFLKAEHQRPGEDIWTATIEPALCASQAAIVIWTENTDWDAVGVRREIEFCRERRIPELLLLERNACVPSLYRGTSVEYTSFDAVNAGKAFAEAVSALRQQLRQQGLGA